MQRLEQAFHEFETSHFPGLADPSCDIHFHVFARDTAGELTGGLRGAVYWDGLEVALLWVAPTARGRGIGSALLKHGTRLCDEAGCMAYLESSNIRNNPLYERFGFEVVEEKKVAEDGPTIWLMRRPASR